jgi:threonine/homoserine efflux transporter RhtA
MNKFSKAIVAVIIVLNIIFTGIVLWIFNKWQREPSALITAWFAFTTGELWALAGIKKAKVKQTERRRDNGEDG